MPKSSCQYLSHTCLLYTSQDKNPAELSYDEFLTKVDDGEIEKVTIDSSKLYVTLTDEARKNEKSDKKTAGGDTPKDASDLINQLEQKSGEEERALF